MIRKGASNVKTRKRQAKLTFGRSTPNMKPSKYEPHQGSKECQRRLKHLAKTIVTTAIDVAEAKGILK